MDEGLCGLVGAVITRMGRFPGAMGYCFVQKVCRALVAQQPRWRASCGDGDAHWLR
jgi:hypothetical protein